MESKIMDGIEFMDGVSLTCTIEDATITDAKIRIQENRIFICQDIKDGVWPRVDTFEYEYAWCLNNGLDVNSVKDIKFISSNRFNKGDYIVCLRPLSQIQKFIKTNYIYKQLQDNSDIYVEKDSANGKSTKSMDIKFKDKSVWRYATKEEIIKYDKNNGPVAISSTFTPGTWYKGGDILVCCIVDNYGYGFNRHGEWFFNYYWNFETHSKEWTEATISEVKAALSKEAKKRYSAGDKHSSVHTKDIDIKLEKADILYTVCNEDFIVNDIDSVNCSVTIRNCPGVLFQFGLWAEVVSESATEMYNNPTKKLHISLNEDIPVYPRKNTKVIIKRIIPQI